MAMACKMRTGYLVGVTGSKILIFPSLGGHLSCDTRDPVQQIPQQLNRTVSNSPVIIEKSSLQLRQKELNCSVCIQVNDTLTSL